jgi:hypothetical protein
MPKSPDQIKPNYSPVYAAALYPDLAAICIKHGYALAVHGSLARDFDLIAIPWAIQTSLPEEVLKEITETFCIQLLGKPEKKVGRRVAYSIAVGFGECCLDFSFILDDVNYKIFQAVNF